MQQPSPNLTEYTRTVDLHCERMMKKLDKINHLIQESDDMEFLNKSVPMNREEVE